MKATSKQEFFELLGHELNRIGIEDTNDIFADFEEHFTDGAMRGIPDDETAERLGDIKEIARSYLNLESSRINSIMARDVERRKVSLTKPGRDVPADLSLIEDGSAKDIANSDNIREYTPEHLSGEIYPQSQPSAPNYDFGSSVSGLGTDPSSAYHSADNAAGGSGTAAGTGSDMGASSTGTNSAAFDPSGAGSSGTGNKTVADAFSDAGKAAIDAAKLTGQVVADAFKQRGAEVKDAMKNAERTAAEAIKTAGHSAAEAVKSAGQSAADAMRGVKSRKHSDVPRPSDTYRENISGAGAASRAAELPRDFIKGNSGYKIISVTDLKPNLNAGKLILAILLDVFLWSWLVPVIIALFFSLAGGALGVIGEAFRAMFSSAVYVQYHFISRVFLTLGFAALACLLINLAVLAVKLIVRLIKFIVNLHIKAVYDL